MQPRSYSAERVWRTRVIWQRWRSGGEITTGVGEIYLEAARRALAASCALARVCRGLVLEALTSLGFASLLSMVVKEVRMLALRLALWWGWVSGWAGD